MISRLMSWCEVAFLLLQATRNGRIIFIAIPYSSEQRWPTISILVWAAGNDGHTMASIENTSPVFDWSLSNNFITVTASDAAALRRNSNGGFDASCNSIAIFSDLAQYREDCVLNAPGVAIASANADFAAAGQTDVTKYGTSQAAPLVTGVGALVQQAFPYLWRQQRWRCVLLSTANNQLTAVDGFFINVQDDAGLYKVNVIFSLVKKRIQIKH